MYWTIWKQNSIQWNLIVCYIDLMTYLHSMAHLNDLGLSVEENKFYLKVKEMLRDSVFMRITLNTATPYSSNEIIDDALSSRILFK